MTRHQWTMRSVRILQGRRELRRWNVQFEGQPRIADQGTRESMCGAGGGGGRAGASVRAAVVGVGGAVCWYVALYAAVAELGGDAALHLGAAGGVDQLPGVFCPRYGRRDGR